MRPVSSSPSAAGISRIDSAPSTTTPRSADRQAAVRGNSPGIPDRAAGRSSLRSPAVSRSATPPTSGRETASERSRPSSSTAKPRLKRNERATTALLSRDPTGAHSPSPGQITTPGAAGALPPGSSDSIVESVLLPAVAIDLDHPAVSQPQARERLADIAEDFAQSVVESGLDPASPEYRQVWDREAATADARFRSMYGAQAWKSHHIQVHHSRLLQPAP